MFTMACGCVIQYTLENVGDYGYGGAIVDHYELEFAEIVTPCGAHGGTV